MDGEDESSGESADDDAAAADLEAHPLNPAAARKPGGFWNEQILPVMDWEAPEHRVVVPLHLQQHLGHTGAVLRWADTKRRMTVTRRPKDAAVANDLSRYLDNWQFVGLERELPADQGTRGQIAKRRYRVLMQDEQRRWYAVSIGTDASGSDNVITLIGSGDHLFLDNRLRGMEVIVIRGK